MSKCPYTEISRCRICQSSNLITTLSLGNQCLTGVFPKQKGAQPSRGPLDLVLCKDCSLLQLKQSYSPTEMYGNNYGYRSGLNASMVQHLQQKILMLENMVKPQKSDLLLDIGSNDATFPQRQAKIITSIAMFYDLESPHDFVRDIASILAPDGIWHFEQSYMPSMLRTNAYDTICHEHLEFYSFKVVKNLLASCGLRVVDVEMNAVNGGSFAVTACWKNAPYHSNQPIINWLLKQEKDMQLETLKPYLEFKKRVYRHRDNLRSLITALFRDGKKIIGYGASTKGNVLLQFCGLNSRQIPYIAEVNKRKYGSFTPGTNIPIISEISAKAMKPDYLLVLPWHFKPSIIEREKEFLAKGGKFIFPLPEIEIV